MEASPPGQIIQHHQTPHISSHNDSTEYYSTADTSPLAGMSNPVHPTSTAMSNGSRPYDDLESEDDLDREDITFPSDAGLFIYIIHFKLKKKNKNKTKLT